MNAFPAFSCRLHHLLILVCLGVSLRSGGAAEIHRYDFTEAHMATLWTITCYGNDLQAVKAAAHAAFKRVDALESCMTDYNPESELMQLSKAPFGQAHPVSEDLFRIMEESGKITRWSQGTFDVTAGPLIQVWRRARRQKELPGAERIAEARSAMGWRNVTLDRRHRAVTLRIPNMRLDLGGIAKGFAADAALKVLREQGFPQSLVAASGDLAIGDAPPGTAGWPVRIGDPVGRTNLVAVTLHLKNVGVSTSGDAEQFVEIEGQRYSHIVDPRTGAGLTNRVQATVIAECATRSDALATAVCILGVERATPLIDRDRRLSALFVVPTTNGVRTLPTRRFPSR